jgi:phosphate transport system substrate-binding protein
MNLRSMAWRLSAGLAALACVSTGTAAEEGTIQIKGSDTMVNLCQAWAEEFMAEHRDVTVAVTGGGSGTGIAALIGGTCDLAASSRKMTDKETKLASSHSLKPQELTAALDGLAVVVHPSNPVRRLTLGQLAELFTGKIQNWKDLGGPDLEVILLSREVNSGTHVYFKEHVLAAASGEGPKEFSPEALLLPSSQAIADEVGSNPGGIGYYGMGYVNPKNAVVAVAKAAEDPYVSPSEATVRAGTYPISRPLLLYSRDTPEGAVKAFLDYVMSAKGQAAVRRVEFVPVAGGS